MQRKITGTSARRARQRNTEHGSYRARPDGATVVGDVDPTTTLTLALHFKRRSAKRPSAGSNDDLAALLEPATRETLDARRSRSHGAVAERIESYMRREGFQVRDVNVTGRRMLVEGPALLLAALFGASLSVYSDGRRTFRARSGRLRIPREIAPWTRAVLGFDQRTQALPQMLDGTGGGMWPSDVARLYGVPLDIDVSRQCVGIIALGGGYKSSDLAAAMAAMGRAPPVVVERSVLGVGNQYEQGSSADAEIALDLQVLAGILPAARIVIYFTANTAQGIAEAIHQAVFDEENRPQVLSVSWGSPEKYWNADTLGAMQATLADAVRRRISVIAASGDYLATGGATDGRAHVWFPASSPYVLGCGGTAIELDGSTIRNESVWHEGDIGTGGGVSEVFSVPDYQSTTKLPLSTSTGKSGRGVPDISALAARTPGYRIVLDGESIVKEGTSAATPLWASIVAIANARRGVPVGLVHPILYASPSVLRPITTGDNRIDGIGYEATNGWSACTGLGAPIGADLVTALGGTTS